MSLRLAVATAFLMGIVVATSAATTITVGQHGMRFARTSASLAKGDRIIFTNEDDVIHNVHILGPGNDDSKDLGLQKAGATLSHKFDRTGTYRVRCNIHPSMRMVVNVR
jgi:plastocyanin